MKLSPIIEIEDLKKIYKNENVFIFDVSNGNDAFTNYEQEHLEGAYFIDLNTQLADIKNNVVIGGRHPLPTAESFAKTLTDYGISKDSTIVIYDDKNGSNAAARFWWMLKAIGHEKVQVLNGGFQMAKKNHFPLSSEKSPKRIAEQPYSATKWKLPIMEMEEVEKISENSDFLVIDVRDEARFQGLTEPIDLIAGHIPGAFNIPFTENLDENGAFLQPEKIKEKYEKILSNFPAENIVIHCGSGVTACHTLLALDYAQFKLPNLYVGSWSEWSRNNKKMVLKK